MNNLQLRVGLPICFESEKKPYTIKAISERFAIATRPIHKQEDRYIIAHQVKMGAYSTKEEAWEAYKHDVIYTLIDFEKGLRGADFFTLGKYDYHSPEDIRLCLEELYSGACEISRRNRIALDIDVQRTCEERAKHIIACVAKETSLTKKHIAKVLTPIDRELLIILEFSFDKAAQEDQKQWVKCSKASLIAIKPLIHQDFLQLYTDEVDFEWACYNAGEDVRFCFSWLDKKLYWKF